MSTSEVVISASATAAVPKDYVVAPSSEIIPLCVTASIDGTGAATAYLATLEIISDAGLVMARCPCNTLIAAGGSADVSWFPLKQAASSTASISFYQQVVLNLPNVRSYWPLDETTGTTWHDLGPSNNPMTAVGSPIMGVAPLITTGHSATFSGAVDGSARSIQYGTGAGSYGTWPGDNSVSVVCWYSGTFAHANSRLLFTLDNGSNRICQLVVTTAGLPVWQTFASNVSANPAVTAVTAINDGVRHMIGATFNGVSFAGKIYIDGLLSASGAGTGSHSTTSATPTLMTLHLGGNFTQPMGGTSDEFVLTSGELTATDMANLFAAGTT